MNRVPDEEPVLVPGGSLVTEAGRPSYSTTPDSLVAAGQVVAIEFQTIAAANDYRRR